MAEIELDNVCKRFGEVTTVNAASFTIRDGEFFILVGPSGCGKSTLLNMIVGLEEISAGELRLDGERINDVDPKDRNMAMVFQSYAIYPHMTVRENLAFPLKLAGMSKAEMTQRIDRAAAMLELEALLDRKPGALSGGQRQRVAMGRALVREPRVFLLDEPLSNLDAKLRVQMRTEIARLQRRLGTTTVYVTHDQTEAMTLGDRIAVMRGGNVLQVGTPRELYECPANLFVAGFIGSPAMNFLPARYHDGRLELPIGSLALPAQVRAGLGGGRPLVAGFRPDHLRCSDTTGDALGFEAMVDVVEWLGADAFVYLDVSVGDFAGMDLAPNDRSTSGDAPDGAEAEDQMAGRTVNQEGNATGARTRTMVARLDPGVRVVEGEPLRLWLAPADVQVFDGESGRNVTHAAAAEEAT